MDKHFTYLLINISTVIFPILLSFDKKVAFFKKWLYLLPGLFLTGCFFLLWDYLFTLFNVWSFNPDYVIGVWFLNLPLEEILFFVTVPFACVFIYECVNAYFNIKVNARLLQWLNILVFVLSLCVAVVFHSRVYTLITFLLLSATALYLIWSRKSYIGRFYVAWLISLIPFYVVNGLLTSIPVVMYNNEENLAVRVGTIPLEDHFYSLTLLLINVILYEYFKPGETLMTDLPSYTRSQLALRNGQDKPAIWVCYKSLIYDVTESRLWKNGKHYEHWAGQDLTDELADAPHTEQVFSRFKVVGVLADKVRQ